LEGTRLWAQDNVIQYGKPCDAQFAILNSKEWDQFCGVMLQCRLRTCRKKWQCRQKVRGTFLTSPLALRGKLHP
jgi:hypothetical protein